MTTKFMANWMKRSHPSLNQQHWLDRTVNNSQQSYGHSPDERNPRCGSKKDYFSFQIHLSKKWIICTKWGELHELNCLIRTKNKYEIWNMKYEIWNMERDCEDQENVMLCGIMVVYSSPLIRRDEMVRFHPQPNLLFCHSFKNDVELCMKLRAPASENGKETAITRERNNKP
jgi:hypothetical protein